MVLFGCFRSLYSGSNQSLAFFVDLSGMDDAARNCRPLFAGDIRMRPGK